MDALLSTPQARHFTLTALVLAVASLTETQAPAGSLEDTGYVDPSVAASVYRARMAALKKLRAPRCRRIFAEFTNLAGLSLDEVLAARGETAESHLRRMAFLNGSGVSPCGRRDVYAFTSPGSLSILLCSNFRKLTRVNVSSTANILIHEMLHSLGAGEAPYTGLLTGYEINSHVELRCGG
jgi:hypothetical protein